MEENSPLKVTINHAEKTVTIIPTKDPLQWAQAEADIADGMVRAARQDYHARGYQLRFLEFGQNSD